MAASPLYLNRTFEVGRGKHYGTVDLKSWIHTTRPLGIFLVWSKLDSGGEGNTYAVHSIGVPELCFCFVGHVWQELGMCPLGYCQVNSKKLMLSCFFSLYPFFLCVWVPSVWFITHFHLVFPICQIRTHHSSSSSVPYLYKKISPQSVSGKTRSWVTFPRYGLATSPVQWSWGPCGHCITVNSAKTVPVDFVSDSDTNANRYLINMLHQKVVATLAIVPVYH